MEASQASTTALAEACEPSNESNEVSLDSVAKIAISQEHIRSLLSGEPEQLSKYNKVMALESSQLSGFILANQQREELMDDVLKSREKKIEDLLQSNKNLQDQLDCSQQTTAEQQKEISQMTDQLAEARAQLSQKEEAEKTSEQLKLEMAAKNAEVSDLRKRNEELQGQLQAHDADLRTTKRNLETAESWISTKRSKLSEISTELNAALAGMQGVTECRN